MKYVIEKGSELPLCAVKGDKYIDFFTSKVLDNKNVIDFIETGLKNETLKLETLELYIYKISRKLYPGAEIFGAYNYVIYGCSNYLDINKQPLTAKMKQSVIDNVMRGNYKQEQIWSDD